MVFTKYGENKRNHIPQLVTFLLKKIISVYVATSKDLLVQRLLILQVPRYYRATNYRKCFKMVPFIRERYQHALFWRDILRFHPLDALNILMVTFQSLDINDTIKFTLFDVKRKNSIAGKSL